MKPGGTRTDREVKPDEIYRDSGKKRAKTYWTETRSYEEITQVLKPGEM